MNLIKTEGLCVGYTCPLLPPLDLKLDTGDVVALLGSNGTGKSTILKTLSDELKPVAGKVTILGKQLENYSRRQLAKELSIVTTDRISAGGMRVREIVSLGRQPHTGWLGHLSRQDKDIVEKSMDAVGISFKADDFFAYLSDGERQKVMIARALAQEASIILLDEPFSFLDTASRIEILSLLKKIARDKNVGIIFSSHDVAQAVRMADLVWLICSDGQLIADTPVNLVRTNAIQRMFKDRDVVFDPVQNDFILRT